jgi:hypothetical protein
VSATVPPVRPALEDLPAPLSVPYSDALGSTNPQVRLRLLIKSFGCTLRYCSLIVVNDCLRLRAAGAVNDPVLDACSRNVDALARTSSPA